jgi:hypothetical protein
MYSLVAGSLPNHLVEIWAALNSTSLNYIPIFDISFSN